MKNVIFILSVFCSVLFLYSCQKESADILKEDIHLQAIFNQVSSDLICSQVETHGSYSPGVSLSQNEFVEIEVKVTKTGTWKYSSDTLNGFSFYGSGEFTDTGIQKIKLSGRGKPLLPGNNLFTLAKDTVVLHHLVSVLDNNIVEEEVGTISYFSATIGGIHYEVENYPAGPDNIPYGVSSQDHPQSFSGFVNDQNNAQGSSTGTLSLQKGYLNSVNITPDQFKNFFHIGAYPFAQKNCDGMLAPGIFIGWVNGENEMFTTILGDDQTGSSFQITGVEDGYDNKGIYYVKVRAKFNCKLYKYPSKEMKELTDGESVTYFKYQTN